MHYSCKLRFFLCVISFVFTKLASKDTDRFIQIEIDWFHAGLELFKVFFSIDWVPCNSNTSVRRHSCMIQTVCLISIIIEDVFKERNGKRVRIFFTSRIHYLVIPKVDS